MYKKKTHIIDNRDLDQIKITGTMVVADANACLPNKMRNTLMVIKPQAAPSSVEDAPLASAIIEIVQTNIDRFVVLKNGEEILYLSIRDLAGHTSRVLPIQMTLSKDYISLKIGSESKDAKSDYDLSFGMEIEYLRSEEIRLEDIRVVEYKKDRFKNSTNRDGYVNLDLSTGSVSGYRTYLTPEISYITTTRKCLRQSEKSKCCAVKNDNSDLMKAKNIDNMYNLSDMDKICISNPLTSLRAFVCDFFLKNLILFGLLVLFQTLLGNPTIAMNTRLLIALAVVVIYNLFYWILKALENIFVWACQYTDKLGDLAEGDDQWMS